MATVNDDTLYRIKEANDIIDVISSKMPLKKAGRNYKGLCPFHSEKTPSFTVNPDKQFFHCFGCGEGGDVFTFLVKYERISFYDAVKKLADSAGITLPKKRAYEDKTKTALSDKLYGVNSDAADFFVSNLKTGFGNKCLEYMKKRGMTKETLRKFQIGCALDSWDSLLTHLKGKGHSVELIEKAGLVIKKEGKNGHYDRFRKRIIFPIFSVGGKIIGFGGRVIDDALPKYLNSPETPVFNKGHNLYALNFAKEAARRLGYLIIVEGYLDAISPHQYGIENVSATLGTALTESHVRLLKRYVKKAVLIFDPDDAGVKAALRGLELFLKTDMKVNVVALPEKLDPDNFVKKHGKDAFLKELKRSVKILDFFINYTIDKTGTETIDDKIAIVNETLPKVSMIKNAIERDYYIKRLSERLKIDEKLIRGEMAAEMRNSFARTDNTSRAKLPSTLRAPILNAEETFLKVILTSDKLALRAKELVNSDDFMDADIKNILEKAFKLLSSKDKLDVDHIVKDEQERVKQLVSKLLVEDSLTTGKELKRAFVESIFKIQHDSINMKMAEIRTLLKKAASEKNEKLKEELLKEYVSIDNIKRKLTKVKL